VIQPSILIVEDEAIVAEDLAQKVKALGYRVIGIASTGDTALQLAQELRPNLVLLDIKLCGTLDGIEIANRLREMHDLPFLFITAHSDPGTVKKATASGTFGYILKPFRERDLEVQLETALYKYRTHKATAYLDLAQTAGSVGFFDYHFEQNRAVWTEGLAQLFGISLDEYEETWEGWAKRVLPEDAKKVRQVIMASVAEKQEHVSFEFRAILPDGRIRWLDGRGRIFYGTDGKPLRMTGVNIDVSERKQAEQNQKKSDDLLLRAQRGAKAGVWEIDLQTDQLAWSKPYYDLFGIAHSIDPSVAAWVSCIHPEDRERSLAAYQQSIKDKQNQNMEFRIVKPDGEIRWIHRQGQIELDDRGNAIRMNGISFDITDRKQAEEVVKAIALFPSQNPSPVLRVSGARILLFINPASIRLLPELNLRVGESVPPDLGNFVSDTLRQKEPQQVEYSLGSSHYLITISPVLEGDYANLYWTDITGYRRAESALRESEARFRAMADTAPVLIWISDTTKLCTWFNQPWINFTGRSLEQEIGNGWAELVHPDDFKQCLSIYTSSFDQRQPFTMEYRLRRHDGEYRWLLDHGIPRYAAEGQFVGYIGSCIDVTERRQAEEWLRESERRLTGLVTTAMDAIISVDETQRITLFNQAAEQMFGCPADQAIGQPLDRFIPDRYQQAHRDHVAIFGRTGTTTRRMGKYGTVYGVRADGQEFPLEASISHLEVGGHKVFTVILRDITQRVQSEQAIRESEERMRQFAGQLEQRVAERTEELLQSESRLRALATELNLAEQRERTRLATDLHDYLAQLLVVGRLTLGQAHRIELPSRAEKLIKDTEETLGKALNYCRTLMAELSPPVLQERGLPAGLIWLGEHMKRQDLEVTVKVDHADSVMLPEDRAVLLFQSVRELLINVAKHGAVKKATVTMSHWDGLLTLVVRDENGFDLGAAAAAAATISPVSSKFGLFSIRERMKALGGTFAIESARGKGTTATLTLPLPVPTNPPCQN
jgi:PAS domain S-box-containing protein